MSNYTKLEEKIDKYLGTENLRPGPPKRIINKKIMGEKKKDIIKREPLKTKINFCSYSLSIIKNIIWDE